MLYDEREHRGVVTHGGLILHVSWFEGTANRHFVAEEVLVAGVFGDGIYAKALAVGGRTGSTPQAAWVSLRVLVCAPIALLEDPFSPCLNGLLGEFLEDHRRWSFLHDNYE
jgi:hypothetical protein